MRVTLSLIQPEFPYKGLDGNSSHLSIPGGKKVLIIRNLDERFTLTIQFFPEDGSIIDAIYSVNNDIMLPLQAEYKYFTIALDKFIMNDPKHSISFDVEFE